MAGHASHALVDSVQRVLVTGVLVISILIVGKIFYNVFLHPLRSYPGPKSYAATRLPWIHAATSGKLHTKILDLHRRYGRVVRTAPNELSYVTPNAWKQIYGHRQNEMPKDLHGSGLLPTFKNTESIVTASPENHPRMRRLISHAFSEKAIREQQDLLQYHVDKMIWRMEQNMAAGPQDLVSWFNWATFDITGDLAFGEPFGCLDEVRDHEWVAQIFQGIKLYPWMQAIVYYNLLPLAMFLAPKKQIMAKKAADAKAYAKLDRRITRSDETSRKDFMSYILRENKASSTSMTLPEIQETAVVLVIAGSETTATFMSALCYYAVRHQHVYQRMVTEVRTTFDSYESIDMVSTNGLKYIPAVIEETFRIYPPSPNAFPRLVPGEGEMIEGRFVPGGTTVSVHPYAAANVKENFYRPKQFLPERWLAPDLHCPEDLPATCFVNDQKQASQPFSFGPRNCIGKSLAYAEIRVMISKLLWSFDLELAGPTNNDEWPKQDTYTLWEKKPVLMNLKRSPKTSCVWDNRAQKL